MANVLLQIWWPVLIFLCIFVYAPIVRKWTLRHPAGYLPPYFAGCLLAAAGIDLAIDAKWVDGWEVIAVTSVTAIALGGALAYLSIWRIWCTPGCPIWIMARLFQSKPQFRSKTYRNILFTGVLIVLGSEHLLTTARASYWPIDWLVAQFATVPVGADIAFAMAVVILITAWLICDYFSLLRYKREANRDRAPVIRGVMF